MKIYALECPHCKGELEIKDGLDTFYCLHCGRKIVLSDMSEAAYQAKVRVREMDHEEAMQARKMDQEQNKLAHEAAENRKTWVRTILGFVIFVFIFGGATLIIKLGHDKKVDSLQALVLQIEEAYLNGDYDEALYKANQLYCDDNWSSEEEEAWDSKREAYIEMIEAKIREEEANNPNNIFMPSSSRYFVGKVATDIQTQFLALGFTNIKLQPASEKAGFFNKEGTVEHILIGGKTEFTTEDYFDKDTAIIIYYYAK